MREILFRGKSVDSGEWVYGSLVYCPADDEQASIVVFEEEDEAGFIFGNHNDVHLKTVGQFTGLLDKNGVMIFEGDILEFSDRLVVVVWHAHLGCWDTNFIKFTNKENGRDDMSPVSWDYKSKVIGNIHDNPELLEISRN